MQRDVRRLAGLGLALACFSSCGQVQPVAPQQPQKPAQEKTWTVVVDGRIPITGLKRKYAGDSSSVTFINKDGKEVRFFGNFYMLEE